MGRIGHLDRPSHIMQLAAAHLMANGGAIRLMHRLRQLRARKRAIVEPAFSTVDTTFAVPTAGPATDVASALLRRGVRTETLAPYYFAPELVPQALLLGYVHLPDSLLRKALSVLGEVLGRMTCESGGPVDLPAGHDQAVRGVG
ncbi:hypothetical protein [Actinocrispum wychmicini]|uniref:Aminotransferase class I and II n=1 Tax=Actinocrispum wychmicini TaxID=1213861 RepID=A0A4R2J9X7_9PSEU|nr:hypothetical protein [Actinocrispum wychmicini]TCO55067.1 hypothetical protein EV192_108355 [Actinocrispum wychmicini]